MTLLRSPATIEHALDRIAGVLTWAGMAIVVGKSERQVRKWGQPDSPSYPTGPVMVKLDAAYRRAGGHGAPLVEALAVLVESACCELYPTADELALRAVRCIKEGGEANAALVLASRPGATETDRCNAAREVQEILTELSETLPLLTRGAGPAGGIGEGKTGTNI